MPRREATSFFVPTPQLLVHRLCLAPQRSTARQSSLDTHTTTRQCLPASSSPWQRPPADGPSLPLHPGHSCVRRTIQRRCTACRTESSVAAVKIEQGSETPSLLPCLSLLLHPIISTEASNTSTSLRLHPQCDKHATILSPTLSFAEIARRPCPSSKIDATPSTIIT